MDFEQYIKRMKATLEEIEGSNQYDISYEIYTPVGDIEEFEESIREEHGIEEFHVWQTFKEFYQVARGITFEWTYRHRTGEAYLKKSGISYLSFIYGLYKPEEQISGEFNLYEGYRIFDYIEGKEDWLVGNYVAVHFVEGREEPDFYYYACDTEMYHKMSIGFLEYMSLLLDCRGLYGWQYFFLLDENFPVEYDRANRFLAALELLFPDADSSKYRDRLKLLQNDTYNELSDRLATIGPVSPDRFVTFYSQVGNFGLEAVVPQENYQIAPETVSRLQQWLKAGKLPDGKPLNFIYLILPSRTAAIGVREQAKADGLGLVYYVDNDDNLWSPYLYAILPESPEPQAATLVESSYWFNPGAPISSSSNTDVDDIDEEERSGKK